MMTISYFRLISFFLLTTLISCAQSEKKELPFPESYDLTAGEVIKLPDDLVEISGIAFAPGNFQFLYAQQDEDGIIYRINLNNNTIERFSFGKAGDYEDITIKNDTIIILKSDGSFYGFTLQELTQKKIKEFSYWKKILPKGEYEGLYADSLSNSIYALCKECNSDKKKSKTTIHQLQLTNSKLTVRNSIEINTREIIALSGKKSSSYKPSAIARHPVTKEFYLVSSVNNNLVILNDLWQIKAVFALPKKYFLQPEGIAFDKKGNMYISSEGDKLQQGTISRFVYKNVSDD